MNTELQIFDFNEQPVRTMEREGQVLFANADVCRVLEIGNSRDAAASLEDDEKITVGNTDGNPRAGQPHQMVWLTESGLYALIFKSRKPAAKTFRRWVTGEVLPEIRRKGGFRLSPSLLAVEEVQEIVLQALRGLRDNTMPVARANAVFLGGRVYVMLSQSREDIPTLPATTPLFQSEEDNIRRVLEWMAKQKEGQWFVSGEMRHAAAEMGIWPWLTAETMEEPSAIARFGKTMFAACDNPIGGLVLRTNGVKGRSNRRFRVEVLTVASNGGGK